MTGITAAILAPDTRHRLRDGIAGLRAGGGRVAFDTDYRPSVWSSRKEIRDVIVPRALW